MKTVKVGEYEPVPYHDQGGPIVLFEAASITGNPSRGTKSEVSSGTLNRITGQVSVRLLQNEGNPQSFSGTCKSTQKCSDL
jgi:hypothetical protein